MFAQLLFVILSASIILAADETPTIDKLVPNVTVGTDHQFKKLLTDHNLSLVEFIAPWCPHCKKLMPEFRKAAKQLPDVFMGLVDCTVAAGSDICANNGVSGYPTINLYRGGKFVEEYEDDTKAKDIIDYIYEKTGKK